MATVEKIGKTIFTVISIALGYLPLKLLHLIAWICTIPFFIFSTSKRRNLKFNLMRTGVPEGKLTHAILMKNFYQQCLNILLIFASTRWTREKILEVVKMDNKEVFEEALKKGKGAILVTAHVGNWELAGLYLSLIGYKLYVVAGVQMNTLLTTAVRDAKEKRGIEVITPMDSYRRFFTALSNNGIIALLLDGDVYTGYTEIPFFGAIAKMPKGPITLSKKRKVPIIGGFCRRNDDGLYHIFCEEIISDKEIEILSEEEALKRVYKAIENYIKINRDQWCIFRNLWE